MEEIYINTEHIKLGQALKLAGIVGSGTDAKLFIADGQIKVDGEEELRRGRKLFGGEIISFEDMQIKVINKCS